MFNRTRKRLVAWLTLICVAFASLSPAVAAATGNRIDRLVAADICSTVGTKADAGAPAKSSGGGHEVNCLYCLSGALHCASPAVSAGGESRIVVTEIALPAVATPPRHLEHHPGAPRAPPFSA